jgi:Fungal specific transcription factor domain/Fungal Zn(2)-Cys(6) binuclear cluster domain
VNDSNDKIHIDMSKRKVTRVRTGCWTCRRRGYKCDEGKPACNNCIKRKVPCEGYAIRLKWTEDKLVKKFAESVSLERGFSEGTSQASVGYDSSTSPGKDSSSSGHSPSLPVPGELSFQLADNPAVDTKLVGVNTEPIKSAPILSALHNPAVYSEFASSSVPKPDISHFPSSSSSSSYSNPIPVPQNSRQHVYSTLQLSTSPLHDQTLQHELIVHYLTNVSEDLCPVDTFSVNIYRDVVVPFSAISTKYAICGLASHYLASTDSVYALLATEFKVEAIKALRISLESLTKGISTPDLSESPQGSAFSDGRPSFPQDVFSTSILLATQEALSGNYDEWRSHVKGGAKLLWTVFGNRLDQADLTPEAQSLIDTLCYHDTVSTIMGDKPLLAGELPATRRANPDSTFSSLAAPIYRLVSRISILAATAQEASRAATGLTIGPFSVSEEPWPIELAANRLQLQNQLESQLYGDGEESALPAALATSPASISASNSYYILSNILRNCAMLYFWLRLDRQQLGRQLTPRVNFTVSDTLDLLAHIDPDSGMNSLLAWPLWQLGVCADSEEIQQAIMARLITIQTYSNRGGMKTIIRFLATFWNLMKHPAYSPYTRRELLNLTKQRCSPVVLF